MFNNCRVAFDLWTEVFEKNMTANVHLLIAHADLYLRWSNFTNTKSKSYPGGVRMK